MRITLIILFNLLIINAFSQSYLMSNGTDTTCSGIFYDSGGPSGNYGVNQNFVKTFVSSTGNRIKFSFTMFSLGDYDYLEIFDGPTTAYPRIDAYYTSSSPGIVESSGDALTFRFYSNTTSYTVGAGWEAQISCTSPILPVVNMNNATDTVNGSLVFYDHEGANANYASYSNYVHRFVAKNNNYLTFNFNMDGVGIAAGDTLKIYDGNSTSAPVLGIFFTGSTIETRTSSSNSLTFEFTSNYTSESKGWQAFITENNTPASAVTFNMSTGTRYVCSGIYRDHGGTGNYGTDQNTVQTFKSYSGNRIKFSFTMFSLGDYDYLEIFDGPTTAYPRIDAYYASSSPGIVESSGDALTFRFYSNTTSYTVGAGWEAQISCTTPVLPVVNMNNATDTVNGSLVFYDHEGANANYASYSNYVHRFVAKNNSFLTFNFNMDGVGIAAGDTLKIYDGNSTSAPVLGIFFTGSTIETRTSSSNSLTFEFTSNYTSESKGWQAFITETNTPASAVTFNMSTGTRYICSGIYRDHGGTGNYGTDQNTVQTFKSYSGNRIKFSFTMFSLGDYDYLEIFDGPTTAYPRIDAYYASSSPGIVESSGDALTFRFYSNTTSYTVGAGWEAQISCTTPVLPVVNMNNATDTVNGSLVFYDHEGANANYASYSNYVHRFVAKNNSFLTFNFNMDGVGIAAGDTLKIYDGNSTSAPVLGIFFTGSTIETRTSSSNSLTFEFTSNYTSESKGWQAFITETNTPASAVTFNMSTGTRYVCSGIYRDHGGTGNYGTDQNTVQTFKSYSGNRIKFSFTMFSLGDYDYLEIFDGPTTAYPRIDAYYSSSSPGIVESSGDALTFRFYSNTTSYTVGAGWEAQISCTTPVLPIVNMNNATDTVNGSLVFYDHEGANANYASYSNYVHHFLAKNNSYLTFNFNMDGVGIAAGDTLKIYDGNSTSAPVLGIFFTGSTIETRTSSSNSLTFEFTSNYTSESKGWQAFITETNTPASAVTFNMSTGTRYVCSGIYRDHGGTGNYGTDQNTVQTFKSYSGNRIKFSFTMFSLGDYDYLEIFDGPTTAYPRIDAYYSSSSPGIVESSGDALTFRFYSNTTSYTVGAGWEAQISCTTPVLPIVNMNNATDTVNGSLVFYDHEGANANYASYSNYVHRFVANSSQYLSVEINMDAVGISSGDTVFIFDGENTNSQPIGVFIGGSIIENFVSSSNKITFKFTSNNTSESRGWQIFISETNQPSSPIVYKMSSGIRYSCDGIFQDHAGGGSYGNDVDQVQTFIARSGQRLVVTFNSFHTAHSYDYLKIYNGLNTSAPLIGTYSGGSNPGTITAADSALTFLFHSNYTSTSSGWNAQFNCINIDPPAILNQPVSLQVCPGDSAVFEVLASGGDTIEFQWKKNGQIISGANSNTLIINSANLSSTGNYYCVVTNPYGQDSSNIATLSLHSLPTLTINLDEECYSNTIINLTGATPAGGTYFGNYITNNQFNIGQAGVGNHYIEYEYTTSNGCTSTISDTLIINPLPTVSFSTLPDLCDNAAPISLSGGLPTGGVYSGNGVSQGIFNPSTAGGGSHTIYYSFTDVNGCSATAQTSQTVLASPTASLSLPSQLCINGTNLNLSGGLPSGGNYFGNGVVNNILHPTNAGIGNHTVSYIFQAANGCWDTAYAQINVVDSPTVSFGINQSYCVDAGQIVLNGGFPTGGNFSGSFVVDSLFNTTQAGVGSHLINYSVTNVNGCTSTVSDTLIINPLPTVSFSTLSDLCDNAAPISLSGGLPTGGVYSGNGVSQGIFNPSIAGGGSHTIYYSFTDVNGCSATAQTSQTVLASPTASLSLPSQLCINGTNLNLSGGLPSGGNYFGNGVVNNILHPTNAGIGNHTVSYIFQAANGCWDTAYAQINVVDSPTVSFGINQSYCVDAGQIVLNGGFPTGGNFSGSFVVDSLFNTTQAGVGSHLINYSVTNVNGCTSTVSDTLIINPLPTVSFSTLSDLCDNAAPISLSGGLPTGGVYSGNGVSQGIFNPSTAGGGSHTIYYSFTDVNGCSAIDSAFLSVYQTIIPHIDSIGDFCLNAINHNLVAQPGGGIWTGNGVSGQGFSPGLAGVGMHTLFYSYTDSNSCITGDSIITQVFGLPSIFIGNDTTIKMSHSLTLSPLGNYTNIIWNNGFTSPSILINGDSLGLGMHSLWAIGTDSNNCSNSDTIIIGILDDTGIEMSYNSDIKVYPNPVDHIINLDFSRPFTGILQIYNLRGKILYATSINNSISTKINIEHLPSGIYMMRLTDKDKRYDLKIIKK